MILPLSKMFASLRIEAPNGANNDQTNAKGGQD